MVPVPTNLLFSSALSVKIQREQLCSYCSTVQQSRMSVNIVNMENPEVQAVTKFYLLKGKTATYIKVKLKQCLVLILHCLQRVFYCIAEKRGRTSGEDTHRRER